MGYMLLLQFFFIVIKLPWHMLFIGLGPVFIMYVKSIFYNMYFIVDFRFFLSVKKLEHLYTNNFNLLLLIYVEIVCTL